MSSVQTVNGPVDANSLGFSLMHEHLFINLLREYRGSGLLNDTDLAVQEANLFAARGGRTIVDCTNGDMGRDPVALQEVARRTGLNIVMGTGIYRVPYLDPAYVDSHSTDDIANDIVRDLVDGVGESEVRAGIIGEIGADKWYVSAHEERAFRAAARAHLQTGVTVTTHAARWPVGLPQLDILQSEGVQPARVIIGHADTVPSMEYHVQLARRGAYVQFDNVRGGTEFDLAREVRYVLNMKENGFIDRVLLSHDVCLRTHLHISGGPGYTLIHDTFIPRLVEAGISQSEIRLLTEENPARALTGH